MACWKSLFLHRLHQWFQASSVELKLFNLWCNFHNHVRFRLLHHTSKTSQLLLRATQWGFNIHTCVHLINTFLSPTVCRAPYGLMTFPPQQIQTSLRKIAPKPDALDTSRSQTRSSSRPPDFIETVKQLYDRGGIEDSQEPPAEGGSLFKVEKISHWRMETSKYIQFNVGLKP